MPPQKKSAADHELDGTLDRGERRKRYKYVKQIVGDTPDNIDQRRHPAPPLECGNPQKWVHNPADELAVDRGCYFDERQAAFVRDWLAKYLIHTQGPFVGGAFEITEWQWEQIIAPVFGWIRADFTRRFRQVYIEIPKKNGKSTLSSAVGLYLLLGDSERGAHIYSAATSRDQASIVHEEAIAMVQSSELLAPHVKVNATSKNIVYENTRSHYRAVSARPQGNEGLKAHAVIADEVHAWRGFDLWRSLVYSGAARKQPLIFAMTTAGDSKDNVAWQEHCYVEDVNAGAIEDTRYYGLIIRMKPGEDYRDRAVQARVNPMMGITMCPDDFAADVAKAQKQPSELATMLRYRFNVWSTGEAAWLDRKEWDKLKYPIVWEDLTHCPAWLAMDLSQTEDITAAALAIQATDDKTKIHLKMKFWLPEDAVAEHILRDQLRVWADAGHLELTEGSQINYADVEQWMIEAVREYNVEQVRYDRFYAVRSAQEINRITGVPVVEFPQTVAAFAKPTRDFEKAIKEGAIVHDGNPVMSWQIGHVAIREDSNANIRPIKPKRRDFRKIDGVIAAVMACGGATASMEPVENYYDTHPVELV